MPLSCIFFIGSPILRKGCTFLFGHRNGKNVGPRDAAWGPVGPSVGQWTCVSRPEATGGLYHKDNEMNEDVFNGSILPVDGRQRNVHKRSGLRSPVLASSTICAKIRPERPAPGRGRAPATHGFGTSHFLLGEAVQNRS
jgi:hypothetical protein